MVQETTPRRFTTVPDAAAYAGVSTQTLRRMIDRGELPAYRIGERNVRVDLADLDAIARPIIPAGGGAR